MKAKSKEDAPQTEGERSRAIRQFMLGRAQIISASICLYFLLTTGTSAVTIVTAIIAVLLMGLSLTFKLKKRRRSAVTEM